MYEGAPFHDDLYFIQHYLMEIKYEEGSDLTEFFLKLENVMKAAREAANTVIAESQKSIHLFHSMLKSWKNDLRIGKGRRKYIPYEDLKQSIEGNVRNMQAQERYTLAMGTTEISTTKNEHALDHLFLETKFAAITTVDPTVIVHATTSDLQEGRVKAGTVLPANFAFKGNSKHDHSNSKNWNQNQECNNSKSNDGNSRRDKNYGNRKHKPDGRGDKNRNPDQGQNRSLDSDSDDDDDDGKRKVFRQQRLDTYCYDDQPSYQPDSPSQCSARPTWTIDSGCTRHWFTDIATSGGSITVGGNNQIPIEGIGRIELAVVDSKGNSKTLTLHSVLYAPQLHSNLLSVPAAVKHDYRFNFGHKHCAVQIDPCFKLKATNTDLYQFQDHYHGLHGQSNDLLCFRTNVLDILTLASCMTHLEAKPLLDLMMLACRFYSSVFCVACTLAKSHRAPFYSNRVVERATFLLKKCTQISVVRCMCLGSLAAAISNLYRRDIHALQHTQILIENHDIQRLQADSAKEYETLGRMIFKKYGTHAQFINAYTPQQNGVAERRMQSWNELELSYLMGSFQ
ncbi:LOW QUALITY PROTEIN: Hypothetical protein PHPALM_36207 [Phytophthora palmivora]|uniref:Retrovirus-related Pol polyprotein from transposon TNT 1-94-like beta-barrel domain-containing protein n=1 Tax=Phytophthora palmivora TaxID=4796 RepID=A0A2P4X0J6_9STRA|nr:LOW QUALITY PROTEIN: Hypothetical protein PHPALM_36207 [Phytophthora palmivora]